MEIRTAATGPVSSTLFAPAALIFPVSTPYSTDKSGTLPNTPAMLEAERLLAREDWWRGLGGDLSSGSRIPTLRLKFQSKPPTRAFNSFEVNLELIPIPKTKKWFFVGFLAGPGLVASSDPEEYYAGRARSESNSGIRLEDIENLDDVSWALGIPDARTYKAPGIE